MQNKNTTKAQSMDEPMPKNVLKSDKLGDVSTSAKPPNILKDEVKDDWKGKFNEWSFDNLDLTVQDCNKIVGWIETNIINPTK